MIMDDEVACPLCGDGVSLEDADTIAEDMEFDDKTCPMCGMNYWEVREANEE